jgi:hypothetical protein
MSGTMPGGPGAAPHDDPDDQAWFDLLAGRDTPGASTATQAEAAALRAALHRHAPRAPAGQPPAADARIARLLDRARAEGVLPPVAAAGRAAGLTLAWRPPRRAWAGALAAGVAVLGLALLLHRPVDAPADNVLRGAAVQQLQAADPLQRRQDLLQALRAAGFDAQPFDRLGRPGIDIALPVPLPAAQARALAALGLAAPSGPSLQVELLPAARP